jgi:pyridoxine 4-dehydrogenase
MTSTQPAGGVPAHRLDTDTAVNRIGYGAMQLAGPGVWGRPDDPGNAVAVLREAVTLGVNFLDTATPTAPARSTSSSPQPSTPTPTG